VRPLDQHPPEARRQKDSRARKGGINSLLVAHKQIPYGIPACTRINECVWLFATHAAAERVRRHIRATHRGVRFFREAADDVPILRQVRLARFHTRSMLMPMRRSGSGDPPVDLVLTLDGDQKILHASSLFRAGQVLLYLLLSRHAEIRHPLPYVLPSCTRERRKR
jgi:hypothetical protein